MIAMVIASMDNMEADGEAFGEREKLWRQKVKPLERERSCGGRR